jgi:hypothetical protein
MYGNILWKIYEAKLIPERERLRRMFGLPKDRDGSYMEN